MKRVDITPDMVNGLDFAGQDPYDAAVWRDFIDRYRAAGFTNGRETYVTWVNLDGEPCVFKVGENGRPGRWIDDGDDWPQGVLVAGDGHSAWRRRERPD